MTNLSFSSEKLVVDKENVFAAFPTFSDLCQYVSTLNECVPRYSLLNHSNFHSFNGPNVYGRHCPISKEKTLTTPLINMFTSFDEYNCYFNGCFDSAIRLLNHVAEDLALWVQPGFFSVLTDDFGIFLEKLSSRDRCKHKRSNSDFSFSNVGSPLGSRLDYTTTDILNPLGIHSDLQSFYINCSTYVSSNLKFTSMEQYKAINSFITSLLITNNTLQEIDLKQILVYEKIIQENLVSLLEAHQNLANFRKHISNELFVLRDKENISQCIFEKLSEMLDFLLTKKKEIFQFRSVWEIPSENVFVDLQNVGTLPVHHPTMRSPLPEVSTHCVQNIPNVNLSNNVFEYFGQLNESIFPIVNSKPISSNVVINQPPKINQISNLFQGKRSIYLGKVKSDIDKKSILALKLSGSSLFVASADWQCYRYDIFTGSHVSTYSGHRHPVTCIEIFHKFHSKRLYTGSSDKTIRCYDIFTTKCLCVFTFEAQIMCLSIFSEVLFVGLSSGVMPCVNLTNNTLLVRLAHHKPKAVSYIFSTKNYLFTGSFDSSIIIYTTQTSLTEDNQCYTFLRKHTMHNGPILCLYFRADILYSASVDRSVIAYNVNKNILVQKYIGHTLPVSSIQVLLTVILTACLDKKIRIFHIQSAELLLTYIGYSDQLFSIVVKNKVLFTGSKDGTVMAMELDLSSYFQCFWSECQLCFATKKQVQNHVLEEHVEVLECENLTICGWGFCQEFLSNLSYEAKSCHILSHTENIQKKFRISYKSE